MLDEAKTADPLPKDVSCTKPYNLTRGCSKAHGGTIKATIKNSKFVFATSDNGEYIYVTKRPTSGLSKGLFGGLTLGVIDPLTKSLNRDVTIIKSTLVDEGVNIIKIRPHLIKSIPDSYVIGYLLELDGNGYEVLSSYIVE